MWILLFQGLVAGIAQEEGGLGLPEMSPATNLALVCHAVAMFASCLDRSHVLQLSNKINTDTNKWLSQLFRWVHICVAIKFWIMYGLLTCLISFIFSGSFHKGSFLSLSPGRAFSSPQVLFTACLTYFASLSISPSSSCSLRSPIGAKDFQILCITLINYVITLIETSTKLIIVLKNID